MLVNLLLYRPQGGPTYYILVLFLAMAIFNPAIFAFMSPISVVWLSPCRDHSCLSRPFRFGPFRSFWRPFGPSYSIPFRSVWVYTATQFCGYIYIIHWKRYSLQTCRGVPQIAYWRLKQKFPAETFSYIQNRKFRNAA
jgi:hypothetical protein